MATFIMLGKYSSDAMKGASADRTKKATGAIEKLGGKVNSMYALLGGYDLVLTVDFPGIEEAMKASVSLGKLTGISFSSFPAVTVERFDKMLSEV